MSDRSPADVFQENLRGALEVWQEKNGKTLRQFASEAFPDDSERRYKWLRKLLSEGSPEKKEGLLNHVELVRLHEFLGFEPGALWEDTADILVELVRKLAKGIPPTAEGWRFRQEVLDQFSEWFDKVASWQPKTKKSLSSRELFARWIDPPPSASPAGEPEPSASKKLFAPQIEQLSRETDPPPSASPAGEPEPSEVEKPVTGQIAPPPFSLKKYFGPDKKADLVIRTLQASEPELLRYLLSEGTIEELRARFIRDLQDGKTLQSIQETLVNSKKQLKSPPSSPEAQADDVIQRFQTNEPELWRRFLCHASMTADELRQTFVAHFTEERLTPDDSYSTLEKACRKMPDVPA